MYQNQKGEHNYEKEYYKQHYAHKFVNRGEKKSILERYNIPKLTQEKQMVIISIYLLKVNQ